MQPVNKELFREWKNHPVTKAMEVAVVNRVEEAKEALVNRQAPDEWVRGMIHAFREVLAIEFDEVKEKEDEDEV
jgi:hypothetical protein